MPFAATLDGASSSVTVTPGPETGVRPTRRVARPSSGPRSDSSSARAASSSTSLRRLVACRASSVLRRD
jgi:hypothetical protein